MFHTMSMYARLVTPLDWYMRVNMSSTITKAAIAAPLC